MNSSSRSLFQLPSILIETGFHVMDAAFETIQSVVETATNQKRPDPLKTPPVNGPADLDTAVAPFANRLTPIARFTSWDPSEPGPAPEAILEAARRRFGDFDLRGPPDIALSISHA